MLIRKELILTSIIIILSRGVPIIAMPLLTSGLSLKEYGLFTIFLLLINLAGPVITGNMEAGILREGIKFHHRGFKLLQIISISSLVFIILTISAGTVFNVKISYLYLAILIIASGYQDCLISYFRANYNDRFFLFLSIGRAVSLVVPAVFVARHLLNFEGLLQYYSIGYVITSLIFTPFSVWGSQISKRHYVYFRAVFIYCIFLIPYTIGQWVISSSSRALLGKLDTMESAGIFSISYTMVSPIILLFSICAIIFSRSIIANQDRWVKNSNHRHKMVLLVIVFGLLATTLSLATIYIDYKYFKLIGYYSSDLMLVTGLISMSLLFQCMYTIYGNILFSMKATKTLAANSIIVAILHIFYSYIFIEKMGIVGAALSLWVSYFLIYLLTFIAAKKVTSQNLANSNIDVIILIVGMVLQGLIVLYFHLEWAVLYKT